MLTTAHQVITMINELMRDEGVNDLIKHVEEVQVSGSADRPKFWVTTDSGHIFEVICFQIA